MWDAFVQGTCTRRASICKKLRDTPTVDMSSILLCQHYTFHRSKMMTAWERRRIQHIYYCGWEMWQYWCVSSEGYCGRGLWRCPDARSTITKHFSILILFPWWITKSLCTRMMAGEYWRYFLKVAVLFLKFPYYRAFILTLPKTGIWSLL